MLLAIVILVLAVYVYLGFKRPGIALITSPIVSVLLFYISGVGDSIAAMATAPVIFVATLVAVLIRSEPDSSRWPRSLAKCILIAFGVLTLSVIACAAFGPLGIIGFLLFVLFIGLIIGYGLTSRHTTAAYVISTIGSSMRQNLPLPMALESAAGGRTDKQSRILRGIQKWLVQGYSLSESIKRGYPKCPGRAIAMIAAAEKIDQLPTALGSIESDMAARADESREIKPVYPFYYPAVLIVFMFFIVLMLMWKVIPIFDEVLREMAEGAELPAATRLLCGIANFVAFRYGWLIGLALALIVFVVVPVSIRIRFRPRRPDKPYLLSRIADFIKWHLPVLHWFENNYSMVQVTELLRLSFNTGCTVNGAIANTLDLDVNNCFRKRLRKWLARVEAGNNVADSARESGLGNTLAWAFDAQVNQGNTLAILETLESFYRSNYSYRVNLARFVMWPCITLVMGVTVGFVVYSMFAPMVAIVNYLSSVVMP